MRAGSLADSSEDPPAAEPAQAKHHGGGKHKHKNKLRSAWISFVGRIVAQISGAAASIAVGLVVVSQYASDTKGRGSAPGAAPAPLVSGAGLAPASRGEVDLAVLPFEHLSSNADDEYFADGMTEALIAQLAEVDGLHVISRTSSMHYKGRRAPVRDVAAELGVDFVVEGTVVQDAGRVRVLVQLVDAAADRQMSAESFERGRGDVLLLQAELSRAIARSLDVTMAPAVERRLAGQPAIDPVLHEQYIKGRQAAALRTTHGFQQAIRHFEQAIRLDPSFAPAHAALATTYALLGVSLHASWAPDGALLLARASATNALEIDPTNAEAHAALGAVAHRLDWNRPAAEAAFRNAIALRPGDALTHEWFAMLLAESGRHREALAEAEFARELDPLHVNALATIGLVHYYARRFDRAIEAERRALDIDPDSVPARLILAWSLIEGRAEAEAVVVCEARPWSEGVDQMLATLVDAHVRRGARAAAETALGELNALESVSPAALLRVHLSRGEIDLAFDVLDRAIVERDHLVATIRVDPLFSRMRRDRRFDAALARLGER